MPRARKTPTRPALVGVRSGEWQGELFGSCTVHYGQSVQPGPPPVSVELSYLIAPLDLLSPDRMHWPGVLSIFVPTPKRLITEDAGYLFQHKKTPCLTLSVDVTRLQFSDLVRGIEAKRIRQFRFTLQDLKDDAFPISGWGTLMTL